MRLETPDPVSPESPYMNIEGVHQRIWNVLTTYTSLSIIYVFIYSLYYMFSTIMCARRIQVHTADPLPLVIH